MKKKKERRHHAFKIDFDLFDHLPTNLRNEKILEELTRYLEKLAMDQEHCKICGSIQPELTLVLNDVTYEFTIFKIIGSNGKVKAETDYEKLGEWCRLIHPKKAPLKGA